MRLDPRTKLLILAVTSVSVFCLKASQWSVCLRGFRLYF